MAGGTSGVHRVEGNPLSLDYIRDGDVEGRTFEVRYKTGWKAAQSPEQPKSWRRPRFVMPSPTLQTRISVSTFQDYEEGIPKRQHFLETDSLGATLWTASGLEADDGFFWGDGTQWEKGPEAGGQIRRAQPPGPGLTGLGVCAAVQLLFRISAENSNGSRWGLDAIILKHRSRRGTT